MPILFLGFLLLLISCNHPNSTPLTVKSVSDYQSTPLAPIFQQPEVPVQIQKIDYRQNSQFISRAGIVWQIPANCWVDSLGNPIQAPIVLQLREYTQPKEIMLAGLETLTTDNRLLSTDGMFYWTAHSIHGQTAYVAKDHPIKILKTTKSDMQLYKGEEMPDGQIRWTAPQSAGSGLIPIAWDALLSWWQRLEEKKEKKAIFPYSVCGTDCTIEQLSKQFNGTFVPSLEFLHRSVWMLPSYYKKHLNDIRPDTTLHRLDQWILTELQAFKTFSDTTDFGNEAHEDCSKNLSRCDAMLFSRFAADSKDQIGWLLDTPLDKAATDSLFLPLYQSIGVIEYCLEMGLLLPSAPYRDSLCWGNYYQNRKNIVEKTLVFNLPQTGWCNLDALIKQETKPMRIEPYTKDQEPLDFLRVYIHIPAISSYLNVSGSVINQASFSVPQGESDIYLMGCTSTKLYYASYRIHSDTAHYRLQMKEYSSAELEQIMMRVRVEKE